MEGIFFYSGFVMILSFHRQNKMTGIGEQFQYIFRDETIHLNFGIDLINTIKEENPDLWTAMTSKITSSTHRSKQAVELEYAYAKICLPKGILGLTAPMFRRLRPATSQTADSNVSAYKAAITSEKPIPMDE